MLTAVETVERVRAEARKTKAQMNVLPDSWTDDQRKIFFSFSMIKTKALTVTVSVRGGL